MNIKSYKYIGGILLLSLAFTACDDKETVGDNSADTNGISLNSNDTTKCKYAGRLEFPHLNDTCKVIVNLTNDTFDGEGVNYCVEWDSSRKSQRWSCYQMHSGYNVTGVSRFTPSDDSDLQYPFDSRLASAEYFTTDPFKGSGYDHGHMCPSADRLYSSYANWQTFYLTNMQPQDNKFNAGIWAKLESQIRSWANAYTTQNMYVVKGGTIDKEEQIVKRTDKGLIIPRYYFSAVLVKNAYGYKTIAFWLDQTANIKSNDSLGKYAISVDKLEELTGIDFFCNLPDDIEAARESHCDLSAWGL